jgi:hypothetical protein
MFSTTYMVEVGVEIGMPGRGVPSKESFFLSEGGGGFQRSASRRA